MKLVADESIEGPTVSLLRAAGYSVLYIAETSPGIEDSEVLLIARREQALLLTADKDFGELAFRHREPHFGVLMIRLSANPPDTNATNTLAALLQYGHQLLDRF